MNRVGHGTRIQGPEPMIGDLRKRGECGTTSMAGAAPGRGDRIGPAHALGPGRPARAGKLSWLDDVVQEVIVEAKAGGKGLAREIGGDGAGRGPPRRAAVPGPRRRRGARAPGPSERGAGAGRPAGRAAGRGAAPVAVLAVDAAGPADPAHLRGACAGREAAGRRAGRDGAAPGAPVSGRGRDDGPPARARGPHRRPGLRRRRGRGPGQGRDREPQRAAKVRPRRLVVLHRARSCRTRRSCSPRASWPRSWPTPRSSSITPAGPPSMPSRNSPRPASSSPRPSPAARPAAWRNPSDRPSPPTGSTSPCSATSAWDWPGWSSCCRSW